MIQSYIYIPFAFNCDIVNLSKQSGAPICTLSSWEYCFPASAMRRKMRAWGGDKKRPAIRGVVAYNTSYEITHDIHGLWLILACVGPGVESVSADVAGKTIYETTSTTWTFMEVDVARDACS